MRWLAFAFSPWGRIDRTRFWVLMGVTAAIVVVATLALAVFMIVTPDLHDGDEDDPRDLAQVVVGGAMVGLAGLVASYVYIAACARRFNDRGKSSWWVCSGFVPVIGPIANVIELGFVAGTPGRNRYGPPCRDPMAGIGHVFDDTTTAIHPEEGRLSNLLAVITAWLASLIGIVAAVAILFWQ